MEATEHTIDYLAYIRLQEEFAEKEKQMQERLWIDQRIAQIEEILRLNYDKPLDEFCQIIITPIAEVAKVFQGVMYLYRPEYQLLKAVSTYACRIEQLPKNTYNIDEEAIGQAFRTQKMILFEDIEVQSIALKNTSIEFKAGALMIVPLTFNNSAFGVLELVFLNKVMPQYIELYEKISRIIAAVLESIHNAELTRKLLMESQQQSEILRAQEEEMRQNLEELQSTQEQMRAKQQELELTHTKLSNNEAVLKKALERAKIKEKQMLELNRDLIAIQEAINNSLIYVELSAQGTFIRANDSFLNLFGYTLTEIYNQHHKIVVPNEQHQTAEYSHFWEKLLKGENISATSARKTKNNEIVWIRGVYSPIKNENDEVIKIIKLGYEITQEMKEKEIPTIKNDYEKQLAEKDKIIAELEQKLGKKS